MKVTIHGNTPMERLTNFTKRIVAVPKAEIVEQQKRRATKKTRGRPKR